MAKTLTPEQRTKAEDLLQRMKEAQTDLWNASLELEELLGFDIDTTQDLQDVDLDEMIAIKGGDEDSDEAECKPLIPYGGGHAHDCAAVRESGKRCTCNPRT